MPGPGEVHCADSPCDTKGRFEPDGQARYTLSGFMPKISAAPAAFRDDVLFVEVMFTDRTALRAAQYSSPSRGELRLASVHELQALPPRSAWSQ